jgi:hypothetical protein
MRTMVKLPPGVLASQHTTTPTGSIIQTLVNPASMIQPMAPLPMLQQSIIQQPMGMSMSGFPPPMMNPSNEIQQDFGRGLASIFSNTGNPLQRTVGNNLMESQVISMGRSGAMSQVQGLPNPMQMMPNNPPPAFPPLPSSLINNNPMGPLPGYPGVGGFPSGPPDMGMGMGGFLPGPSGIQGMGGFPQGPPGMGGFPPGPPGMPGMGGFRPGPPDLPGMPGPGGFSNIAGPLPTIP